MNILALIAAFGGGAFGAALGALPAFIMTGFMALVGTGIAIAGGADVLVSGLAFGSFFGPHISFAGGVAAVAYAARKSQAQIALNNGETEGIQVIGGADITYGLNGTGDPGVILMGGLFGILGFLIQYLYANVLSLQTDTVAMTVATLGIVTRLVIGRTGLIGKYECECPRKYMETGKGLLFNIIIGLVVGIVVCYVGAFLLDSGVTIQALGSYPAMCFGISAITLIFAQYGTTIPTTHHISLPAANAFVLSGGNPIVGVIVAIVCSLLGDFFVKTVNSYCDSHIDPPACTIFIMTFIIMAIF
ncbi:hypothetical protein [Intestinibacter sp.]